MTRINSYGTLTYKRTTESRPENQALYQQTTKREICKITDFAFPADHRIKLKECEKELRKMKVTIIPIGKVTKGLLKGLEDLEIGGQMETIQTRALLKTARILRRILESWGDLLSLNLQWKSMS